ncbi:unnamed protein product [Closterium sp. NIES-64]|nr:unnamed protein product [Closterium sp. NIES-64]
MESHGRGAVDGRQLLLLAASTSLTFLVVTASIASDQPNTSTTASLLASPTRIRHCKPLRLCDLMLPVSHIPPHPPPLSSRPFPPFPPRCSHFFPPFHAPAVPPSLVAPGARRQQAEQRNLVGRVEEFEGELGYHVKDKFRSHPERAGLPIRPLGFPLDTALLPNIMMGYYDRLQAPNPKSFDPFRHLARHGGASGGPSGGPSGASDDASSLVKLACHGPPCPSFGPCSGEFPNIQACWNEHLVDEAEKDIPPPVNCPLKSRPKGAAAARGGKARGLTDYNETCSHRQDFTPHEASALQLFRVEGVYVTFDGLVVNRSHVLVKNGCRRWWRKANYSPEHRVQHLSGAAFNWATVPAANFYHFMIELLPLFLVALPLMPSPLRDVPWLIREGQGLNPQHSHSHASSPMPIPMPIPMSVPMPIHMPIPMPIPMPIHMPIHMPIPMSVPMPIHMPIPMPIPMPIHMPIPMPVPMPIHWPLYEQLGAPIIGINPSAIRLLPMVENDLFHAHVLFQPMFQDCDHPSRPLWRLLRRHHLLHPTGLPLFNPNWTYRAQPPLTALQARELPSNWVILLAKRPKGKRRSLVNYEEVEAEVMRIFKHERVVIFEGFLPILEARALFRRTRLFVASHGASLTNMIFMPEGATVLELRPDECPVTVFHLLANACSLSYHVVFGKGNWSSESVANVPRVSRVLEDIRTMFLEEDRRLG